MLKYTLIFKEEPEGGYTVIVPSLPGCVTYGKTLTEARRMALDAILGYLKSLEKHKEPIPYHLKTLPKGTLHSLLKEAGIDREEFLKV